MPAYFTHKLAAETVYRSLPQDIKDRITSIPLYLLGSQGGDFGFFYPSFGSGERNLGSFLHKQDPFPVFLYMAEYCRKFPSALSFCLGYVTHYAADAAFHPYVYSESKKRGNGYIFHAALEKGIDGYFYAKEGVKKRERINRKMFSDGELKEVAGLFSYVCEKTGRGKITLRKLRYAYDALDFFTNTMTYMFIGDFSCDDMNAERGKWEKMMRDSVSSGGKLAVDFFGCAYLGEELRRENFARDFSGIVRGESKKRDFRIQV